MFRTSVIKPDPETRDATETIPAHDVNNPGGQAPKGEGYARQAGAPRRDRR